MTRRRALHGAVFAGISLLVVLAWCSNLLRFKSCYYCDGKGWTYCDLERTVHPCLACTGPHAYDAGVLEEKLDHVLASAVPLLWLCVGLATFVGLLWALKLVDCRLCGGEGRIHLEAEPVDAPRFDVDVDCAACEGRGRLGVLDRWVLWNGWEREG